MKCLLIYPNPESALNEEAGKLLLEQYQDYFSRATMMTQIHAQPSGPPPPVRTDQSCSSEGAGESSGSSSTGAVGGADAERCGTAVGKKRPVDKVAGLDRKKKDKKKALKRL